MSTQAVAVDRAGMGPSRNGSRSSAFNQRSPSLFRSRTQDGAIHPSISRNTDMTRSSLDPERPDPPRPPSPPPREENAPPPADEVTHSRLAAHYSGLVLASMIGTLIRLGLDALATYDGMVIYSLAWSQGVGCGIMGLALARKNDIVSIYPPLYTFLTTGIAGSVTTFSSWMLDGYLSFSNFDKYNRKGLHDTVDGLAYSFSTFAIALACISLGAHMASIFPPLPRPSHQDSDISLSKEQQDPVDPPPKSPTRRTLTGNTPFLDISIICTAALAYLAALLLYFLAPASWRHRATFAILLGPPGTILRFALARLNTHPAFLDRFPLGTFLANIIATLVISGVYAAQRRPEVIGHSTTCNALYAIQQGFCGCLSTVSTFAVEARAIKGWRWKWFYIGGSVVLGHVLVLAIVGGIGWSEGYADVCQG
ncbi:CrcB-like protein-domain-containing protein [Naematelia encephala]|uniref:CrcB-like protein-domain-containing protein n=1 Tax=Naematelia encephala TaxID=71784 RepID=A0A1Y2AF69_9TREE|nr:CrcB-like protein-domain-containing protein [Naematelia encephala]